MACTHLGIIFLTIAALAVAQEASISLESNQNQVEQGDNIVINCILENLQLGSHFLRIEKFFQDEDNPIVFATNNKVDKEYDGRMDVTFELKDEKYIFTFTLSGARAEDSGRYSCGIYGSEGVLTQESREITVNNVDDFSLSLKVTRVLNGDEFIFRTGEDEQHDLLLDNSEDFEFDFETSFTNPVADITVMVGDQNIFDQFDVETKEEVFTGEGGLKGITFSKEGKATLHVDHSYTSGLVIKASINGQERATETFNVRFTGFPPKTEDCDVLIKAGDHERDVSFTCNFLSIDAPEISFYYDRELLNGSERVELFPGNPTNNYIPKLEEDPANQRYTAVLEMPTVFPQMFMDYYLLIENAKGNVTHMFTLQRDPDKEFPNDSSQAVSPMVATLVSAVMSAVLLRF